MTESGTGPQLCAACRVLDVADGVEDGKLYRNIHTTVHHERRMVQSMRNAQDRAADTITTFAGSMNFIYLHSVWFAVWILINLGALGASLKYDKFPFGLLTMIVSLEAIFLSTFVMISQNRQAARSEVRSEIDFENNVRAEIWSVHIGTALGIDAGHVEEMVNAAISGYRGQTGAVAPPGMP